MAPFPSGRAKPAPHDDVMRLITGVLLTALLALPVTAHAVLPPESMTAAKPHIVSDSVPYGALRKRQMARYSRLLLVASSRASSGLRSTGVSVGMSEARRRPRAAAVATPNPPTNQAR